MKECCRQYLDEQFGGDADIVNEIYNEYVSSMNTKVAEAEARFAEKNWEQLDRVAHAVKGNSLAAGDQEVANVAIALRNAAKLQDEAESGELVGKLRGFLASL